MRAPAEMATSGSGPPASHATTATPNTARPLITSGRSSATGTVARRAPTGARSSAPQEPPRGWGVSQDAFGGPLGELPDLEVADDEHQAQEEHEHVEVHGGVGGDQRQHAEGDHGHGAQQARRRAVEVDEGEPLNGDENVGSGEDDETGGRQISQLENSTPWAGGCSR